MKAFPIYIVLLLVVLPLISTSKPRVFVFTDINIDAGDPDDRQSLVHLFWYANELQIEGIVPDRWYAGGYEACQLALDAYREDFSGFDLESKNYPHPEVLNDLIATDLQHAFQLYSKAASVADEPLYVLIWGNMVNFGKASRQFPQYANNIRVITIGTGLMLEKHRPHLPDTWPLVDEPCRQYNWNGFGRNDIFNDPRFKDMWWVEINWTYEGMFSGDEPTEMFEELGRFGELGLHLKDVTKNKAWAQYFRVGDTPTVLYVIDPENDLDDPTQQSWAGRFKKPFPDDRPNYYTDHNGNVEWDYENPCNTWQNHTKMRDHAVSTLVAERPEMYQELLEKLERIYKQ